MAKTYKISIDKEMIDVIKESLLAYELLMGDYSALRDVIKDKHIEFDKLLENAGYLKS